ncbi:DNA-directed RNA polymerase subunit delta [Chitinophaga silvisoli]|uniref:DNA-directed RNA polymerase subunit delta n=1 Tax=Chitinophaga silvisoli TaxID=2291814 RepID=A0A3E1P0P7_9BACT|nr:DNA-directed RNA polymerase subunit delta [Chitinophaga silvisoli]
MKRLRVFHFSDFRISGNSGTGISGFQHLGICSIKDNAVSGTRYPETSSFQNPGISAFQPSLISHTRHSEISTLQLPGNFTFQGHAISGSRRTAFSSLHRRLHCKLVIFSLITLAFIINHIPAIAQNKIIVYQTDFGLKDGAVAEMKGVALGVSSFLQLFDLTHEIPAYNIWEAAYRLQQTAPYWPTGTVFVSVVDPGVGSSRKSVVLKTKSGHFFVTPDNGTLTLVAKQLGIAAIREIDESRNRRQHSAESYTFHGRDVYSYTAARLASGMITFEQVGPKLADSVVRIPFQEPVYKNHVISGNIPVLDIQYGNIWTNIDGPTFNQLKLKTGDTMHVKIFHADTLIYTGNIPYVTTFSAVPDGAPLAYLNSLLNVSFALNMDNFSLRYHIYSGPDWKVAISFKNE